jgi:hypothetical protein
LILAASLAAAPEAGAGEGDRPEISFYHWRTVYDPGPESAKRLEQLAVRRLYLRFFEVTVDGEGHPVPQATAVFRQKPAVPVVPVIFMENRVFSHHPKTDELAGKLLKRVMDMAEQNGVELAPELHLDCDWTRSTRKSFFEFADDLKSRLPKDWELVATLRLDQYRNYQQTGVPPAHRGVLMAYNMGSIKRPGPGNSIIDPMVVARYVTPGHRYPLPLDLALPIFSWVVVFDEYDRYQGLLSPVPAQLASPDSCLPIGGGMYVVVTPFPTAGGWPLLEGWRLRLEESPHDDLLEVAKMLRVGVSSRRLIFYHLDESLILDRSGAELEKIADELTVIQR